MATLRALAPALRLAAVAAAAGCLNVSGLTGGADTDAGASSSFDGGITEGDDGDTAAGSDIDGAPTTPLDDAGASIGDDGGGGGGDAQASPDGFCATQSAGTSFCTDFDEGSITGGWTATQVGDAGRLSLDFAQFRSAPGALLSAVSTSATSQYARLARSFPSQVTKVRVAFDMRLGAVGPGPTSVVSVWFTPANHRITFELQSTVLLTIFESSGTGTQNHTTTKTVAAGTWVHAVLDIDLGAARTTSLSLDGATVVTAPIVAAFLDGPPTVYLGVGVLSASQPAWQVDYDNLTVTLTP